MANYCVSCQRHHSGWECPTCKAAAAVAAQAEHAAQATRDAAEQREATDRLREEIADAAARAEEAMEERRLDAERQAADLQDAMEAAAEEQRENIANAWALQSEAQCERAWDLWRAHLFDEGLRHAERAVALDSGNLKAHIIRGELLGLLGRPGDQSRSWETQIKLLRLDRFATPGWADSVLSFVQRGSAAEATLVAFVEKAPLSGKAPAWGELIRSVFDRGYVQMAQALWTKVASGSDSLMLAADGVRLSPAEGELRLEACLRAIPVEKRREVAEFYTAVQRDKWLRASDKEQIRLRLADAYRKWNLERIAPKAETFFVPMVLRFSAVEGALIIALVYWGAPALAPAIVAGLGAVISLNVVRILAANRRRVARTYKKACAAFVATEAKTWDVILAPGRVEEVISDSLRLPGGGTQATGIVCAAVMAALAAYFSQEYWREASDASASAMAQPVSTPRGPVSPSSRARRPRASTVAGVGGSARPRASAELQPGASNPSAPLASDAPVRPVVSPDPEAPDSDDPATIRISGAMRPPVKTRHVPPEYPDEAREHGVEGTVIVEVTIAHDGSVKSARVLRSVPLLDAAALDAVKQWEFLPTTVDGRPVAVVASYAVSFAF